MDLGGGTFLTLCGVAAGLGVRHGFDADHLSAIDGLARRSIQTRPVVARLAGVLFSMGHCAVVLVTAVATATLMAQWRIPSSLAVAGTTVSIMFLLALGALNLRAAWIAPHGQSVRPVGLKAQLLTGGTSDHPLIIAGVGMLFALSFDTLSQAAAISLAASQFGGLGNAILAAVAFSLGMIFSGGLNGLWISHLVRAASERAAIASRVITLTIGLLNLAVGLLALVTLASPTTNAWASDHALLLGAGVLSIITLVFALIGFIPAEMSRNVSTTTRLLVCEIRLWRGASGPAG